MILILQKPVVIGENGATEIFTDEKRLYYLIAIPYKELILCVKPQRLIITLSGR